MIRISFPPGAQQGRDMCWLGGGGEVGVRYCGHGWGNRFAVFWFPRGVGPACPGQPVQCGAVQWLLNREILQPSHFVASLGVCMARLMSTISKTSLCTLPPIPFCLACFLFTKVNRFAASQLSFRRPWQPWKKELTIDAGCPIGHVTRAVQPHNYRSGSAKLQQGYLLGSPAATR